LAARLLHLSSVSHAASCPKLVVADISPKEADSRFDPNRTPAGWKSRSAARPGV